MAKRPGVRLAHFDQCQFGLVTDVAKLPVKKRTSILTNSQAVYSALHGKYCPNDHKHQIISGSEGGKKRSQSAQCYPDPLVLAIVKSLMAEVGR